MKFKLILILFTTTLTLSITATSANILPSLEKELSKAIHNLNRDTSFYHYFSTRLSDNYLRNVKLRYYFAEKHTATSSKQFWNVNNHRTKFSLAGPGFYLASDPFISSPEAASYSGANFGNTMIEITFNKGREYLSVTPPIQLSQETIKELLKNNILDEKEVNYLLENHQFSRQTLRRMVKSKHFKFREQISKYFEKNNISLIEYRWFTALSTLCNSIDMKSAMVYIGNRQGSNEHAKAILTHWPLRIKNMDLTSDELFAYKKNKKLRKVLRNLKFYESRSRYRSAKRYLSKRYSDPLELAEIRNSLFKCN